MGLILTVRYAKVNIYKVKILTGIVLIVIMATILGGGWNHGHRQHSRQTGRPVSGATTPLRLCCVCLGRRMHIELTLYFVDVMVRDILLGG